MAEQNIRGLDQFEYTFGAEKNIGLNDARRGRFGSSTIPAAKKQAMYFFRYLFDI
jgi:hypothetical protein